SPQIAWISPSRTRSETPSSAVTPGYRLTMSRISRIRSLMALLLPRRCSCGPPRSGLARRDLLGRVVAGVDEDLLVVLLEHHLHLEQVGGDDLGAVVVGLGVVDLGLGAVQERLGGDDGLLGELAGVLEDRGVLDAVGDEL